MRVFYSELQIDSTFWKSLFKIDELETERVRECCCPHCGGRLHSGDYPRKPRGLPEQVDESLERRFSFCCSKCRRRTTPQSVRFLGRKVYAELAVVLVSYLCARREAGVRKRCLQLGMSERTVRRWLVWWERLRESSWWKEMQARFMPPLCGSFIVELFDRFEAAQQSAKEALAQLFSFLVTLTVPDQYPA